MTINPLTNEPTHEPMQPPTHQSSSTQIVSMFAKAACARCKWLLAQEVPAIALVYRAPGKLQKVIRRATFQQAASLLLCRLRNRGRPMPLGHGVEITQVIRSEEHTSELQSHV